jgi:hypothetical protein
MARACGKVVRGVAFLCGLVSPAHSVYHLEVTKPLSRFSSGQLALLVKLKHANAANLTRLQRILVPDRWDRMNGSTAPCPKS